jgi:prepilin-type N-terminal cleavage/methylation domain-containing protein
MGMFFNQSNLARDRFEIGWRRCLGKRNLKGFTLIELLIVIAIILILIAIALPNFLEAQIRAKIVRAKGELRTVGIAMEAYYLDWKFYPCETEGDFRSSRLEGGIFWLTAPIAYITSIPEDPFAGVTQNNRRTYEGGGIEKGGVPTPDNCPSCLETWVFYSSGPSENSEPAIRSSDPHWSDTSHQANIPTYSATNGTRSAGTLHWYGGDPFWIGVRLPRADRKLYNQSASSYDSPLIVDGLPYLHRLPPHL